MSRTSSIGVVLFAAFVMAAFFCLTVATEARSEPGKPTAEHLKELAGVEDRVLNESPKNPYHQVVDDSNARGFEAEGYQSKRSAGEAFAASESERRSNAVRCLHKVRIRRDDLAIEH